MIVRPAAVAAFVAPLVLLAAVACGGDGEADAEAVKIGALLPLSGALASYGETSNAALADALLVLQEGRSQPQLVTADTKTDPAEALVQLKKLEDEGIRLVIGPYSSSEVRGVKEYADQNGIVLISPLSTAQSLAVANDNVLRFTPDDGFEAQAVAAVAYAEGIRVIIPITRDDEGNKGLQTSMKAAFEKLGGSVAPLITYGANETNFDDEVRALAASLSASSGGRPTGIYLTAFAEVTKLFAAAAATDAPGLRTTRWYGSDSVALSKDLIADRTAAAFAVAAGYPNPILGLADANKSLWGPVSDRLTTKLGRTPDAFALATYDAMIVGHKALMQSGSGDAARLRDAIVGLANSYTGLTGATKLNPAGDRALGNYDFWSVCARGPEYTWIRTITYTATSETSGQVDRTSC